MDTTGNGVKGARLPQCAAGPKLSDTGESPVEHGLGRFPLVAGPPVHWLRGQPFNRAETEKPYPYKITITSVYVIFLNSMSVI